MTATVDDGPRDSLDAVRPPAAPRRTPVLPPRQPVGGPFAHIGSGATMVALMSLWFVAQVLVLSGVAQKREQELLYSQFRTELAAATAPIGPTTPPGDPVALLSIPRLGVEQVVVEGTASGDTLAAPGHLRSSVLPGQVGTSFVMGRASTYGAPFRDLNKLTVGDEIKVVMAQGEVSFDVVNVRRAGDELSQPLPAGGARLTLVTAEGAGRLAAISPEQVLYVDADAPKGFVPPSGRPTSVPDSELAMRGDSSAYPLLALHLALLLAVTVGVVAARQRWSAAMVWVVATPLALALAWATTDVVMRLLPNVI